VLLNPTGSILIHYSDEGLNATGIPGKSEEANAAVEAEPYVGPVFLGGESREFAI
jgi:hypothetical protein